MRFDNFFFYFSEIFIFCSLWIFRCFKHVSLEGVLGIIDDSMPQCWHILNFLLNFLAYRAFSSWTEWGGSWAPTWWEKSWSTCDSRTAPPSGRPCGTAAGSWWGSPCRRRRTGTAARCASARRGSSGACRRRIFKMSASVIESSCQSKLRSTRRLLSNWSKEEER